MKTFTLILFFMSSFFAVPALSEEIEINSKVVVVNPDREFFVISAGEARGVELGDGLIVHRSGEKIAEAYVIEVRPEVSAVEILNVEDGKEIREGDSALIVKERERRRGELPKTARKEFVRRPAPRFIKQGENISIEIHKDPGAVFSYTGLTLKENGYSIISSSRTTGTLLANKPINLSLLKELFADAFAAIDHNVVVSIKIKNKGSSSILTGSSFTEHFQKNKYIKRPVTKNSKYYNDLADLIYKIKERAEY